MVDPVTGVSDRDRDTEVAEQLSWLRAGLTIVLDLASDATDQEILEAVARARNAELKIRKRLLGV